MFFVKIGDNGQIDKDAFSDFLGDNVSENTLLKLNEMSSKCVESTGYNFYIQLVYQ